MFFAIEIIILDILLLAIVIPWRKRVVEEKVKWAAVALLPSIFFAGIVVFISLHYTGDECTSWFVSVPFNSCLLSSLLSVLFTYTAKI